MRLKGLKCINLNMGRHHTKLSIAQALSIAEESRNMKTTPCANGIGSIIYGMVCSKPNMAHVVSIVSRYVENHG